MIYSLISLSQQGFGFARIIAFLLGYLLAIVFAFSLHEYAHAKTAFKLGDPTPRALGRLTINPLKHIDAFGLVGFLIVGFGWAKPVEYNPMYFKKYRRDTFLVSIAGVLTNLVLAFICSGLLLIFVNFVSKADSSGNLIFANNFLYLIYYFLFYSTILNIALFVFNLLPIYPLDGFNTLKSMFKLNNKFINFMYRYGNIILIIFLFTPIFDIFYGTITNFISDTFIKFWGLFLP